MTLEQREEDKHHEMSPLKISSAEKSPCCWDEPNTVSSRNSVIQERINRFFLKCQSPLVLRKALPVKRFM